MARRKISNPLALAVLACLFERPMHPYEMATTLRARNKDESIKLNYGSLYSVVDALHRGGLIESQETTRQGRRPERTVYRITDSGAHELLDWLGELLSTPVKEYTQFEAGLSFLPVVTPDDAVTLLGARINRLELDITGRRSVHAVLDEHIPRLFSIEYEYKTVLLEAELAWLRTLVRDIESGALGGSAVWAGFHASDGAPEPVRANGRRRDHTNGHVQTKGPAG
ncbi:MAG TPA: PadR family transcriptional regulator [Acidimicrobiales bacterium]|nr:PadR family transcriptional regulator [Acidimicrobiales bacterium]